MRLYGVTIDDIEAVMADPQATVDRDEQGNPRHTASVAGRVVRVVISTTDPEMVLTVYTRRS